MGEAKHRRSNSHPARHDIRGHAANAAAGQKNPEAHSRRAGGGTFRIPGPAGGGETP
jgi:hypothetical protein